MTTKGKIFLGLTEFFVLALLSLIAPIMVYLDLIEVGRRVSEVSFTEVSQEVFLLITMITFAINGFKHETERGFSVLVTGFFTCMLIRELDVLFDQIWHGFWSWPAGFVALSAIGYSLIYQRNTILEPLASFCQSRAFVFIAIGLVIILAFSRVFGSGNLLWDNVMSAQDVHAFKSAIQEGLELLGYTFLAYGSCLYLIVKKKLHP